MREWGYAALREAATITRRATTSSRISRQAGRTYFRVRRILRDGPFTRPATVVAPSAQPGQRAR